MQPQSQPLPTGNGSPHQLEPKINARIRRIIIVTLVTAASLVVAIMLLRALFAPTCFTANDYRSFYGSEPDESESFSPGNAFFTGTYLFQPNSASIEASESDSPETDIEDLAALYKQHTERPIIFTIVAEYSTAAPGSKAIAEQRASVIQAMLKKAGIPDKAIAVSTINRLQTASTESDTPGQSDSVVLTLASNDSCRE